MVRRSRGKRLCKQSACTSVRPNSHSNVLAIHAGSDHMGGCRQQNLYISRDLSICPREPAFIHSPSFLPPEQNRYCASTSIHTTYYLAHSSPNRLDMHLSLSKLLAAMIVIPSVLASAVPDGTEHVWARACGSVSMLQRALSPPVRRAHEI